MFNSLQIGRAVAALLVVLHHATLGSRKFYGEAFGGFWGFGNIGVDFFFVLSGFIIYWAHKNDVGGRAQATLYSKKRFFRLYPAFIPISIAMLALYMILPNLSQGGREISLASSLFLIPTMYGSPALSVSWTLMHEFLFYVVFSLFFISRKAFWIVLAVWSGLILVAPLSGVDGFYAKFILNMHNLQFSVGVLCALYYHQKTDKGRSEIKPGFFILGSLVMAMLIATLGDVVGVYAKLLNGLLFGMVILSLISMEISGVLSSVFRSKILLFLGAASYSIYLIHNPFLSFLNRVGAPLANVYQVNVELIFIGAVIASILAGAIYYKLWEKPVLALSRKWIKKG
ncbi:MAG: hypothetical protein AOY29_05950 [Alcanivorax borkumensis]|nr:acyltransferase [Alcanivorax borkumensis]OJH06712.1 MAG: hypothetical protein AOY29_05950 [Alcanivorax borkumensis]|tara:strand:- start:32 stop:1057 length:1026 start_codon:yes stop_codon:yes gene_type:complete